MKGGRYNRHVRRWSVLACVLLCASTAFADDAAEIKKRGDDAMDSGRPADALAAYVEAYALSKDPALLYNKGRALQALTEYPRALEELESFEKEAPPEMKARVPGLQKMIAELRQKVTTLSIACDVDGATVRLRDRTIGRCPMLTPVGVNAGTGRLEVTADGYNTWTRDVELPGGGSASFDVHLTSKSKAGILIVKSAVPNVDVAIDGKRVGQTPVEASLDAGTHTLELTRSGYRPARTSAVLGAGERREIEIPLEAEPTLLSRWWFWTGIGVVVVSGVALGVALAMEKDPERGTVPPGVVTSGLERSNVLFSF